ncbi:hypothetical protein [Sulfurovum sp. NBC37-1]|uniref:hypothetical protein n=1 Tax=Sulfurovum sp. (strain NBC37-1) TaxID=387093 RepID=UPI00015878F9|nr:hypothetical protein [Sulfurovum sp. NBC37-1]BAF71720.1 conserved hypothetical protein [Sulfurovum sp. NBC37-1]
MTKKIILLSMAASVSLFAQSELEELKALLAQQIKTTQALQKRVEDLEKKQTRVAAETTEKEQHVVQKEKKQATVKRKEPKLAKTEPSAEEEAYGETDDTVSSQQNTQTFDQKSFLPDIALILDGSAVGRNVNNSTYETQYIPGFTGYNPNEETEIPFNKNRGFNFNYAELALHSTVGPYFDADAIFHLQSDEFETEEAYITTRSMPYGLRAKMGKFRSEFGRINAIHQHAWKFTSQPLVFAALFGPEGVNDAGVQLQWVLPTDTYLMAGFEAMQGSNDVSFGDTEKNNLYIGYLKSGFDISDTSTLLAGASILHGKNDQGLDTDVYGADLTVKTTLDSYSSLTWQSELLYRNKTTVTDKEKQSGYYTQLYYQYNENWAGGIRYDSLFKNIATQPDDLDRISAVLEYKPFEFTKFRLQYAYDRSKAFGLDNDQRKNISEILLEFTVEAGAHGAHAF